MAEEYKPDLTQAEIDELEKKFDSSLVTRENSPVIAKFLYWFAVAFAFYHIYTAGFGTPVEHVHMGIHLSGLFVMIFAAFPFMRSQSALEYKENTWWRWGNVPVYDWVLAAVGVMSSLYLTLSWNGLNWFGLDISEQALRQGDPHWVDIVFGTALVLLVLEITRRALGYILPMIICVFIAYALLGPVMPLQILKHPGVDWRQFVNNMYFPSEGIFGVTLWVVSTVVFHFVLFGVVAQRMGLGQFFIDNAMVLAGKYTGGPAKVSVVSSAFFGTISGSSIANTVSTGSLTIPNMKKMGYPAHFAGGVEAASSAGGQITPPIMGAASFLMAEFLEVPYTTIVIAALVPALMHYIGVMSIVHFTAKRLGLKGYTKDQLPNFVQIWKNGWYTVMPLAALLITLFSGYSPNMAAFMGLMFCIVVGFTSFRKPLTLVVPAGMMTFILWKVSNGSFSSTLGGVMAGLLIMSMLHRAKRYSFKDLFDSFHVGVGYALAVGAACAAVGIVVGVINTTGVAFRLGFMVTTGARDMAEFLYAIIGWIPLEIFQQAAMQQFISLVLIAIACILMGAGLPTTALYIMLVSVAQPALAQLGVPVLATHMFVLYYGVISEITPPVCASAYAAAGIAGADPFKTGVSAFTLGIGKLMVPMVFVYAPTMLIVLPEYFTIWSFLHVSLTSALGIFMIATAVSGYFLEHLNGVWRWVMAIAGLLMVAPSMSSNIVALFVLAPVLMSQLNIRKTNPNPVWIKVN
ncbi:TRAP transporter permease [Candidatus Halocynthiibacter alkanivorans]|jgi:TRAP transporter 4TM/12TM fusion protein|uniref:TRAP transporter permease n=1 Tax=Candidatus Halocynthiibacter alkanivorans TaxID=2267619 RepID=UPI000DF3F4E2|nr:TRAP transporter permease [Candidatus Halocynthiibacter alkanivorans]